MFLFLNKIFSLPIRAANRRRKKVVNAARENGRGKESEQEKTRPDTRPPVADGWAGAEMRVFTLFDSCSPTDRLTDGRTDGRTDGQSLL